MPRGNPDWGVTPYASAVQSADPAAVTEYGAYGFNRLDGLGRVLLVENWRNGLEAWRPVGAFGGLTPELDLNFPFVSPASVRLDVGAGGPPTPRAVISNQFVQFGAIRLGLEFSFRIQTIALDRPTLTALLLYTNGGVTYTASVVYDGVLSLVHSAGSLVLDGTLLNANTWQQVKISADFETGDYLRANVGGAIFDVTGLSMIAGAGSPDNVILASFTAARRASDNEQANIGYVILTRDEPE